MQIKNKELAFLSLCGDWDYRKNVDMIEPHLQGIAIREIGRASCRERV